MLSKFGCVIYIRSIVNLFSCLIWMATITFGKCLISVSQGYLVIMCIKFRENHSSILDWQAGILVKDIDFFCIVDEAKLLDKEILCFFTTFSRKI